MTSGGRPRSAVLDLPAYRPGRTARQAATAHDVGEAVRLSANEAPYGPLPSVARALASVVPTLNRYPDPFAVTVRTRLAEALGVPVGFVTVGAGSVALLFQLAFAYVDPGDEVVFPWPSFEAYPIVTRVPGGRPATVPLRRDTVDVERLAYAVTPRSKLVVIANPNNPTGTVVPGDLIVDLADRLPAGCVLVVDEAYREFRTDGDPVDTVSMALTRPNIVVLGTFSKAYGLAGLRIGYAVGNPDLLDVVNRVAAPFAVSAVAQAAAVASLDAGEELTDRLAGVVSERERIVAELRATGLVVPDTAANFVWLPLARASADVATGLERAGVVTRPFAPHGLRVTVGRPEENDRFLTALTELVSRGEVDLPGPS